MSSLFSVTNIDINDSSKYCLYYEDSSHPFSKLHSLHIKIGKTTFKSVEHYYQSQKFAFGSHAYKQILNAKTPQTARLLAEKNHPQIRKDWNKMISSVYYKGQKRKFLQHSALKQMLLDTKQKAIICIDSNDTYLGLALQIYKNKHNEKTLKGENNAGIILCNIRDELLLNDSEEEEDEQKVAETSLIEGNVCEIFNKTYSAIFAPFLLNVVVRLLNNSQQMTLDVDHYVLHWGGGIEEIRRCCIDNELNPLDKTCSWDTLIDLCCVSTPATHEVWIKFLNYNKIKLTKDTIKNLYNLLSYWEKNGRYHGMYGSYPTAEEQEFYVQDTIPREISEILNYAIINNVFKDAFIAMDDCLPQKASITKQATSFISSLWKVVDKSIAAFIPMQQIQ